MHIGQNVSDNLHRQTLAAVDGTVSSEIFLKMGKKCLLGFSHLYLKYVTTNTLLPPNNEIC